MNAQWHHQRNMRLFGTQSPVALVTGSTSDRVGRKVAELFLECQFRVAFHGHGDAQSDEFLTFVNSLADRGHQTLVVSGPIESETSVRSWLNQILNQWGRVDVLVNSAAIWEPKALEQTTASDMRRHWEVNCLGSFLTAQIFGLQMVSQVSGGAIVNIGDWAVERPYSGFAAYFLSKGCIETLTRTMAVELAERNPNIRVNAVMPGPVLLADGIAAQSRQRIVDDCLLKREGTPRDVSEAVYYLATSPFVTGACLRVDGGRSVFAGRANDSIAHPDLPNAT